MEKRNYFIFTGGPGSGKTTVVELLRIRGFSTVEESGRKIIKQQVLSNENAVPWLDRQKYASMMEKDSVISYLSHKEDDGIFIFDRGIPDTLGYSLLENLIISESLLKSCREYRYSPYVFLFPFWEEIYMNDEEREQDREKAEKTSKIMKKVYTSLGYEIIKVPFLSSNARADWVEERIKKVFSLV